MRADRTAREPNQELVLPGQDLTRNADDVVTVMIVEVAGEGLLADQKGGVRCLVFTPGVGQGKTNVSQRTEAVLLGWLASHRESPQAR